MDLSFGRDSTYVGQTITANLFGANLLFDRDSLDLANLGAGGGSYLNAIEAFDFKTLRYPGGAITEKYFNLRNPNSSIQNGVEVTPLDDFLKFCGQNDIKAIIVIPTVRLFGEVRDSDGNRYTAVNDAVIRKFILDTLAEARAHGTRIDAFELGNEWYSEMSATEYGRIASRLGLIVQDAIDEFRGNGGADANWVEPKILAQTGHRGRATEETTDIVSEFTAEELSAIDGLVTHRFLNDEVNVFWKDGIGDSYYGQFEQWRSAAERITSGIDLDFYVTEWNVKGKNAYETGLRSASSIVWLFSELVAAGVSNASFWAILQNNPQNLTVSNGLPGSEWQGLSISGEMFKMLREETCGMRLITSEDLSWQLLTIPSGPVLLEAFGNANRNLLYLSSRSDQSMSKSIDISHLADNAHYAFVTILGVKAGKDPLDPNARPVVTTVYRNLLDEGGMISVDLQPWETAQISVLKGSTGLRAKGSTYDDDMVLSSRSDSARTFEGSDLVSAGSGHDLLFLGSGNDTAKGGLGHDKIVAGFGTDLLFGGFGDDTLLGMGGDDHILGGAGHDLVRGGVGADLLIAEAGRDTLRGGPGGDTLDGGAGLDHLYGGMGADVFVMSDAAGDVIFDFDVLHDKVRFRDGTAELSEVTFTQTADGLVISGVQASFVIKGLTEGTLPSDVWIF